MTDKPTLPARKKPVSRKLVTQTAGPVDTRRHPRGLTRKIKIAIDAMIFDRCTRLPACERAGITERAFYLALAKPEVAAYWNAQIQVSRTGERARNITRLAEIRDAANNMPAVKAVQVLEQLEEENRVHTGGQQLVPGIVFVINSNPAPQKPDVPVTPVIIEATPAEPPSAPVTSEFVPSRRLAPQGMAPAPRQRFLDYDDD